MMERKKLIRILMFIGSIAGGYIPALWGESMFSFSGVLLSACGGFLGIWLGYQLGE